MTSALVMVSLMVWSACFKSQPAAAANQEAARLELLVESGVWKSARVQDVRAVLGSASREFFEHASLPDESRVVRVTHHQDGPRVLFQRGREGEFVVHLNATDMHWAQFAFQFSHEICHIACRYRDGSNANQWFEETICECASLFTLRKMAESWKSNAPYPNWRSYSKSLAAYADERVCDHRLPVGVSLPQYCREHRKVLSKRPFNRDLFTTIATELLVDFERDPALWETIAWLNAGKHSEDQCFEDYLAEWLRNVPERHKKRVTSLLNRLCGNELVKTSMRTDRVASPLPNDR